MVHHGRFFSTCVAKRSFGGAFAAALVVVLATSDGLAADNQVVNRLVMEEVLHTFHLGGADVVSVDLNAEAGEAFQAAVPLDGELHTLSVVPHSNRAPGYQLLVDIGGGELVEVEPGPVRTIRGRLLEDEGSTFSGSLLATGLSGRVETSDGREYWIEPLLDRVSNARADQHIVYTRADILPSNATCGTQGESLPEAMDQFEIGADAALGGACGNEVCIADLACDADVEYFTFWGSVDNVEDRIHEIIELVNEQYENDVLITHAITTIIVRTVEPDPYTTTNPSGLLNQLTNYWNANHGAVVRDTVELFTGKELAGTTIGIAWLPGLCFQGTSLGYNLVQSDFGGGLPCRVDLSSHELGHNWNAQHCNCAGYTMNASLNCAQLFSEFHATSVAQIVAWRNSHQFCLVGGKIPPDEPDPPVNDDCEDRPFIGEGTQNFSTLAASEDGPDLPAECDEGDGQGIDNDIWYCYVSQCQTGFAKIETCGEDFDTRVAAYNQCSCPTNNNRLLGCDDDGCGVVDGPSDLVFPVSQFGQYLIRIGGDEQGAGSFTISCVQQQGDDANIDDAKSLRTHNATELAIDLDDTSGIEPRQGGVSKLQVHMTEPLSPGTVNCGNVQINCAGGALACDSTSLTGGNRTVTVNVSGATAQADCCTFSFNGMETDSGGDVVDDYSVVIVEGDINFSGAVTGADPSLIKPHFGEVAGVDLSAPEFDFDVSGAVTGGDFSLIKTRLGNAAPACP